MQVITSKQAQNRFGQFSRDAQHGTVLVTNHNQPVFLAIPVRITATVAKLISEVSPRTGEEAGKTMRKFFADLEARRPQNPDLSEDEINALIKSASA